MDDGERRWRPKLDRQGRRRQRAEVDAGRDPVCACETSLDNYQLLAWR